MKHPAYLLLACLCALLLVPACSGGDRQQMLGQLEELERMNRADSVMQNDSLAEQLVEYFDRHGTPNERMRAHYILGRTYADMGEAPAAVNAYLDAADAADTTAADCDYRTLSRVYGQMSDVFYWQNLMEDYLRCLDMSVKYAWNDKDTVQALNEEAHKVVAYNRLKRFDDVIESFDSVFSQLLKIYGMETAAKYSVYPVNALLEKENWEKAKYYLDCLMSASGYFDSDNNVERGREVCYYYIGRYYLLTHHLDSAEYYFRKELAMGLDADNQQMASYGLSQVFSQTNRLDSAIKYAVRSYNMLDTVFSRKAADAVQRMAALHDYSRHQDLANQEHQKAEREKKKKELLSFILFVVSIAALVAWYYLTKKRQDAMRRYQMKVRELTQTNMNLQRLKEQKALLEELSNKEIIQKSEELNAIQQENKKLTLQIQESNEVLAQLRKELMQQHEDNTITIKEADVRLEESSVYCHLQSKALACSPLTDNDWREIERLVKDTLPGFYTLIVSGQYAFHQEGRRLCFLLRLHVGLKEAAALMGVSQPKVSKLSRKILLRVFQEEGSGKELTKRLEYIL